MSPTHAGTYPPPLQARLVSALAVERELAAWLETSPTAPAVAALKLVADNAHLSVASLESLLADVPAQVVPAPAPPESSVEGMRRAVVWARATYQEVASHALARQDWPLFREALWLGRSAEVALTWLEDSPP